MDFEPLPKAASKVISSKVTVPDPSLDPSKLPPLAKALIAPARFSDGPTLFQICLQRETGLYEIHESLPTGEMMVWPEPPSGGPHQAETLIYNWREVAAAKAAAEEWKASQAARQQ